MLRRLAIIVILLGIVSLAMGVGFIYQGVTNSNLLAENMRIEEVNLGIEATAAEAGELVDTLDEAQTAADAVREHRQGIARTYEDLLAGERFDPTNPSHLSYAQALNLENYLYLAVVGFGLTTVITISGIFMLVVAIALGATGAVLFRLARE
ncbi:hypothetical protein ES703_29739 [subsurface metagenome]